MVASFPAPCVAPDALVPTLRSRGHAVLDAASMRALCGIAPGALEALGPSWGDLPPDRYLRDGGRYRFRRHACFTVDGGQVQRAPHRAHYQPVDYNALHGGIQRWFEPVTPAVLDGGTMRTVLGAAHGLFTALSGPVPGWRGTSRRANPAS